MSDSTNYKIIFHIDMNAFFCSVAQIIFPHLKNQAFAIGRETGFKGVISTASYEARKQGIHAGMPLAEAYSIFPKLIVVNPDYNLYTEYHRKFVNLIKGYSSLVEVASIDEVYADMTLACVNKHPYDLALEIQNRLLNEFNLPSSTGIAPTLFLAKMASDLKKPLGITILRKRDIKKMLYPLSVKEIFGIGKKTYPNLIKNNINTIGDFMNPNNQSLILRLIGQKSYEHAFNSISGNSSNIVEPNRHGLNESISTSETFDICLSHEHDIIIILRKQTKSIHKKMVDQALATKTVNITLRDSSFRTITRSRTIDYTDDLYVLMDEVIDLFEENYNNQECRLVGCGFSNLKPLSQAQLEYNLFTYELFLKKDETINDLLKEFKEKYGENFIKKGA